MKRLKLLSLLILTIILPSYIVGQSLNITDPAFEGDSDFYEIYPYSKINKETTFNSFEFTIEQEKGYFTVFMAGYELNGSQLYLSEFLDFDQFRIKNIDSGKIVLAHVNEDDVDAIIRYYLLKPGRYLFEIFISTTQEQEYTLTIENRSDNLKNDRELQNAIIKEIPYTTRPEPEPEPEPEPNRKDTTIYIISGAINYQNYHDGEIKISKDCLIGYRFKVKEQKRHLQIDMYGYEDRAGNEYIDFANYLKSYKLKNLNKGTIVKPYEIIFDDEDMKIYSYVLNKGDYRFEVDYTADKDIYVWILLELYELESEHTSYIPIEIPDPDAPLTKDPEIKIPATKVPEIKIPEIVDPNLGNTDIANLGIKYAYDDNGHRINRKLISLLKTRSMDTESGNQIVHLDKEIKARIYPNPTKGQLAVDILDFEDTKNYAFNIYNINGVKILSKIANESYTTLDISSHPEGIYILHISKGDFVSTWKIIKN